MILENPSPSMLAKSSPTKAPGSGISVTPKYIYYGDKVNNIYHNFLSSV